MHRITIIGTGLIGTSLGLAIKRSSAKDIEIVGTDIERGNAGTAQRMGAIDRVSGRLGRAAEDARLVIIATPVMAMKDILEIIAPSLSEGCVVTDTGGCKRVVMGWAEQYLPPTVSFVGGNPMAGKESSGPEGADGSLFEGRPYCIIPSRGAQRDAVKLLAIMAQDIGARPYFLDAAEHDSFVAAVSHLPLLLSVALVGCTAKSPSWSDIAQVASNQYRDLTKLASGDPVVHRDLLVNEGEEVVHWIDACINELYGIRKVLIGDADGKPKVLEKVFSQAIEARNRWLAGVVGPGTGSALAEADIPSTTESMVEFFAGRSEARRRLLGWGGGRDRESKDKW